MEKNKKNKRMFENIYDYVKCLAYSNKDISGFTQMEREFAIEAKKELTKFLKGKNFEWDGDKNIISFGKHFRFQLLDK